MFWHEVVYLELLYCATNFELVSCIVCFGRSIYH